MLICVTHSVLARVYGDLVLLLEDDEQENTHGWRRDEHAAAPQGDAVPRLQPTGASDFSRPPVSLARLCSSLAPKALVEPKTYALVLVCH